MRKKDDRLFCRSQFSNASGVNNVLAKRQMLSVVLDAAYNKSADTLRLLYRLFKLTG